MVSPVFDSREFTKLMEDIQALEKKDQGRVMRKATRKGAQIIAAQAKKNAPKRTGKLQRNIVAMNMKGRPLQSGAAAVFVRTEGKAEDRNNAFYWRFVELGTVNHPPVPFIRPAYESTQNQVDEIIVKAAMDELQKALGG